MASRVKASLLWPAAPALAIPGLDIRGAGFQIPRMALTPSTMLALGTPAPDFNLPNIDGKHVALADFKASPALVVMFICNHCPYVKHLQAGIAEFAREYTARGLAVVAINANDTEQYPEDSPRHMAEESKKAGYVFPYLFDATQQVAHCYTPNTAQ